MAFKLAKTDTFKAQVEISTQDDKGRTQKETVTAVYKRLTEEQLEALDGKNNAQVCREVLVDVQGMLDDDNHPVPYNDDTKEGLLQIPPATFALAAKFWILSRMGREKN